MANTNYDGIYGSDANTNIIDARIVLKHDTLGNWNNSSIILDKGEIALTGILKTTFNGLVLLLENLVLILQKFLLLMSLVL